MLMDVELLVNFFGRAIPSLAPHGSIIVTLFEGMPYTLWNIRDLARHSGLAVERSFKFQAAAYPGYHHARTLGVVKTGAGEASETGWKGEERPARSFVFVKKEDVAPVAAKRKRVDDKTESENDTGAKDDESELEDPGNQSGGEMDSESDGENQD
jgi:25S rRNA (uracil2634-N3)-methyltransferase